LIEIDTHLIIEDPEYSNYIFRVRDNGQNDNKVLQIRYGNERADFPYNAGLNGFFILGMRNNIYGLEEVESYGFEGKEMFASKRGYIWSRTIPLLDEAVLTGYGPDTFAIFFPQEDVLGKFKYYGTAKKIVDKPHNFYLQIWVNTGLISLIAVITLFVGYFLRNFINYFSNNLKNYYSQVGLAFFAAFAAYAAAAFFNDSVLSVAPVFWTILGLGIAVEFKKTY
jgi:O-antigen ligase